MRDTDSRRNHDAENVPGTFDAYVASLDELSIAEGSTTSDGAHTLDDPPSSGDARFTDWLRERSEPAWTDATTHRFTRELGAGELDDTVFTRYLVQDFAFVETLVSVVGYAVGAAPSMSEKRRLASFLDVLTDDETDYFHRSFDALDVPESDRTRPALAPVTEHLEDLFLRAALDGGYAETLAVLVPAEWVYLDWAQSVDAGEDPGTDADELANRFYLDEWVTLHTNPAFEETVAWLRRELDAHGPTLSPDRQRRVAHLFTRTVEYEVAFFDAAYADSSAG